MFPRRLCAKSAVIGAVVAFVVAAFTGHNPLASLVAAIKPGK